MKMADDNMTPADWEQWMLQTAQAPLPAADEVAGPANVRAIRPDVEIPAPANISATPFTWKPDHELPHREWLYGRHLIRGRVSLDVAAGGVGKTALSVGDALAMASGRDLFNKGVTKPLRVWLYNLEDDREELDLRIHAAMKYHRIKPEEIAGRLYVDSGLEQPCIVAQTLPTGTVILVPTVEGVIATMRERGIDVLSLDPFVSAHSVSENDNGAIDMVVKRGFVRIAYETKSSVRLFHHIRKGNGEAADVDSARGASALIGAARSVLVYNRMTENEAEKAQVDPTRRKFYFRVTNEKANLAPPPERADWYEMKSVEIDNATDDYPENEKVGVAAQFVWPASDDAFSTADLRQIQERINVGTWRDSAQSSDWAGVAVAEVLGWDHAVADVRKDIKGLLAKWVRSGALIKVDRRDEKRRMKAHIEVGEWVVADCST